MIPGVYFELLCVQEMKVLDWDERERGKVRASMYLINPLQLRCSVGFISISPHQKSAVLVLYLEELGQQLRELEMLGVRYARNKLCEVLVSKALKQLASTRPFLSILLQANSDVF